MTQEEYKKKKEEIREQQERLERELDIAFAKANNPYKIGDIIEDHIGVLLVEKIIYNAPSSFSNRLPRCSYKGTELTKKLEPKKRQDPYREAYQDNVKRKIGEQLSVKPE